MAGGTTAAAPSGKQYHGSITIYVLLICIVAATGELIFGTSGVTSKDMFLQKLFPKAYAKHDADSLGSQVLLFTSWLYLAVSIAIFVAGCTTPSRRSSTLVCGVSLLIGVILNVVALGSTMITVGRIFLAIGVGHSYQAVSGTN